jgi:hypothetical protein
MLLVTVDLDELLAKIDVPTALVLMSDIVSVSF